MDLFGSKNVCNSIAKFMHDGETSKMMQLCKLSRVGFSDSVLHLCRIKAEQVPISQRHRIVSVESFIENVCRGLTRTTNLSVFHNIAKEQLEELNEIGLANLSRFGILEAGFPWEPLPLNSPDDFKLLTKCINLKTLRIHGHTASDVLAKSLFDAGIRLESLHASGTCFIPRASFKFHPERLVHLSIYHSLSEDQCGFLLPNSTLASGRGYFHSLETLILGGWERKNSIQFYHQMFGDCRNLTSLTISYCDYSGIMEYIEGVDLKLDTFSLIGCNLEDLDVGKWTISKSLEIGAPSKLVNAILVRCCSLALRKLSIWEFHVHYFDKSLDESLSRFGHLRAIVSDQNHVLDQFSESPSITHIGVGNKDQLRTINLPPNARHLLVVYVPFSDSDPKNLVHRRFWDTISMSESFAPEGFLGDHE